MINCLVVGGQEVGKSTLIQLISKRRKVAGHMKLKAYPTGEEGYMDIRNQPRIRMTELPGFWGDIDGYNPMPYDPAAIHALVSSRVYERMLEGRSPKEVEDLAFSMAKIVAQAVMESRSGTFRRKYGEVEWFKDRPEGAVRAIGIRHLSRQGKKVVPLLMASQLCIKYFRKTLWGRLTLENLTETAFRRWFSQVDTNNDTWITRRPGHRPATAKKPVSRLWVPLDWKGKKQTPEKPRGKAPKKSSPGWMTRGRVKK